MRPIKDILKDTPFYDLIRRVYGRKEFMDWKKNGKIPPVPHLAKQAAVREYAKKFSAKTLIETGTYLGEMVDATKDLFEKIFSIELDGKLYMRAEKKFSKYKHIRIIKGDSGKMLEAILPETVQPCLFWLDGHYSGGITAMGDSATPIMLELKHIFGYPSDRHVILIDDARLFVGRDGYPAMEDVQKYVAKTKPGWLFEVKDDIIRIHQGV